MAEQQHILFERLTSRKSEIGLITLNRSESLNALSHDMIRRLDHQLKLWQYDPLISVVIIRSNSNKAFCAGGDIRQLYQQGYQQQDSLKSFFRDEYRLNRRIFHYPKPYVALLDGITMGGGVGISLHGSHPVAGDDFIFAMPETGIGFFPDIGASFLLSRCPGKLGNYLALTGMPLSLSDSYYCKILKYRLSRDKHETFLNKLLEADFSENAHLTLDKIINLFKEPRPQTSTLMDYREIIDNCFAKSTLEDTHAALIKTNHAWATKIATILNKKSPTSLKITLKLIQLAQQLGFDDCIRMEYRIVNRVIKHPDFYEGVRALLIDKDKHPNWQPNTLAEVDEENVASYFKPLSSHELEFDEG